MKQTIYHILILLAIIVFVPQQLLSQNYTDYIGAGHSEGIVVSTSDNHSFWGWEEIAAGNNTINGRGLDSRLMETSRFLSQAGFGANLYYIDSIARLDFEMWIDNQFNKPLPIITDTVKDIYNLSLQMHIESGEDSSTYAVEPRNQHFTYAWWQLNITNEDLLRQRVALALSEILVISFRDVLQDFGIALSSYYDVLLKNSFGNYENLLYDVALHPSMGVYLSHLNNPREIVSQNIHPDENFARELMQLFSIGLYELNLDGSLKTDDGGNNIPTYDIADIKEFAKVFTGLGAGGIVENEYYDEPEFGVAKWFIDFNVPMAMYEGWHETGEKQLLNDFVIPSGQSGLEDIQMCINHLFNHDNTGPFISRRLIQALVKSNPSPEYIARVASIFNDDGSGERGNMKALVKAILLDEEARDCYWINDPSQGKLREPMQRYFHFSRAMDKISPYDIYWNVGWGFFKETGQSPLGSPTVFNFFLPDYQPSGTITEQGMYAPEFQIHNSQTSIAFVNKVDNWMNWGVLMNTWETIGTSVYLDKSSLIPLAKDPQVLVNRLDILLTHGNLSDEVREIIETALTEIKYENLWDYYLEYRVNMALYLFMMSPDYAIQK